LWSNNSIEIDVWSEYHITDLNVLNLLLNVFRDTSNQDVWFDVSFISFLIFIFFYRTTWFNSHYDIYGNSSWWNCSLGVISYPLFPVIPEFLMMNSIRSFFILYFDVYRINVPCTSINHCSHRVKRVPPVLCVVFDMQWHAINFFVIIFPSLWSWIFLIYPQMLQSFEIFCNFLHLFMLGW